MLKYGYSYSIIVFVLCIIVPHESVSLDNEFIIERSDINVYEAVQVNALNSIFSGQDVEKLCKHLDNYVWYVQKDDLNNLLINIDARINNEKNEIVVQQLKLRQAWIAGLLGEDDKCAEIFERAMKENWDSAHKIYYEYLMNQKDYLKCIKQVYTDTFNKNYESNKDLFYIIELIGKWNAELGYKDLPATLMLELSELDGYPYLKELIIAISDVIGTRDIKKIDQVNVVFDRLTDINNNEIEDSYYTPLEKKHLYLAFLYLVCGDFEKSRSFYNIALSEDYDLCKEKLLWSTWYIENVIRKESITPEITNIIIPDKVEGFPVRDEVDLQILDMHAKGLLASGDVKKAETVFEKIRGESYPNHLAAINSAYSCALIKYNNEDYEGCKLILKSIIEDIELKDRYFIGQKLRSLSLYAKVLKIESPNETIIQDMQEVVRKMWR